jgi:hypothetical protein
MFHPKATSTTNPSPRSDHTRADHAIQGTTTTAGQHRLSFPEYNGNEELSQWLYKCHLEAYMEGKGDSTLGFSLGWLLPDG